MISVCTLVRGRTAHLANLLTGIAGQTVRPDEVLIAYMQDAAPAGLPDPSVPVRELFVPGDPMPLARARNAAAAAARGDMLIFLDVDCIPSPTLVARYGAVLAKEPAVYLGEVRYLPPIDGPIDPAMLTAIGERHPAKPALADEEIRAVPSHGELWGLSFALPRTAWDAAGGMDETYVGYGGEETDFGARLAAAGVPMAWVGGAVAYHQHHAVHIPPLHQFDAILRNATLFRARWGRWCMDYWLGQFAAAGLIEWSDTAEAIAVLRRPFAAEVAASFCEDARFS
ncbi:galactosyltransferase-related protein [Sphingomonas sp. CFBP 13720]|uniref:galactosyltransferase-related protein n=1 Tax=Sphingomonas sp. CFBP 13720 TaxID=2775302 RepID=UPI001780875D|nr:glycosyltransferase [Sphingomonas sp. CFBP 13720]